MWVFGGLIRRLFLKWYGFTKIRPAMCKLTMSIHGIVEAPASRTDSKLSHSQWETSLQSNSVSHWLGANLESALRLLCISNQLDASTHFQYTWWRHQMEAFSALLAICAGNSPVPGEFPTQRPVTRSFDVYFDLRPNKRLSKQSWGWWFETQFRPSWRHRNVSWSLQCLYSNILNVDAEWCIHIYDKALSYYLNQWWGIMNCVPVNILQYNFNQNINFLKEKC